MAAEILAFATDADEKYFSDNTPNELIRLFQEANLIKDVSDKTDLLRKGVRDYPDALDAHIALYKFLFRSAQYREAEVAAWHCLFEAARQGDFRWNYRLLKEDTANWLDDHSVARLYLFTLKALGVIRLRQNKILLAKRVLTKLIELDPHDEIGGTNFLNIALSFDEDDEDE